MPSNDIILYELLLSAHRKLGLIIAHLGVEDMAIKDITDGIAQVKADAAAEATVNASAIALLNGIVAQLAVANNALAAALGNEDPVAIAAAVADLNALHTTLSANTADLAAAVTTNTPAVVPVVPAPVVVPPVVDPNAPPAAEI